MAKRKISVLLKTDKILIYFAKAQTKCEEICGAPTLHTCMAIRHSLGHSFHLGQNWNYLPQSCMSNRQVLISSTGFITFLL